MLLYHFHFILVYNNNRNFIRCHYYYKQYFAIPGKYCNTYYTPLKKKMYIFTCKYKGWNMYIILCYPLLSFINI